MRSFVRHPLIRVLGVVFAVLLCAVGALKVWVSRSQWVRDQLRSKVAGRLGPSATLGDELALEWAGYVTFGPLTVAASRPELPPLVSANRISVRPRWLALLRGRLEPGVVHCADVVVEAGDGAGELRAFVTRVRGADRQHRGDTPTAVRSSLPQLTFQNVTVRGQYRGRDLSLAAALGRVEVSRDPASTDTSIEAWLIPPAGGLVHAHAELSADGVRSAGAQFEGGVQLTSLLPMKVPVIAGGTLSGNVTLTSRQALREGELTFSLGLDELSLHHARLSAEPVGPMALHAEGTFGWNRDAGQVRLAPFELAFGTKEPVKLSSDATLQLSSEVLTLRAQTIDVDYQRAVAAMPEAFAPHEISADIAGPLSLTLDVKGPLRRPLEWNVNVKLDLTALRQAARAKPHALTKTFVYQTTLSDGRPRSIVVGPSNPSFVPISEIPPLLIRAVLLSEDSMFLTHQGFDFFEMKNGLFAQSENGETVLRGASTITQQLAKNLYLSREKTYARKVREAFLTLALEAAVPKERLLEMYFNIIEWGPGLNGLSEASRHYFGKAPSALSVKQLAYLATIIPSPVRYYGFFAKRSLPEVWEKRVADQLNKMHDAGDLSDGELAAALASLIDFAP